MEQLEGVVALFPIELTLINVRALLKLVNDRAIEKEIRLLARMTGVQ